MSRAALQHKRADGADRFYGSSRTRRTQHYVPRAAAVSSLSTSGVQDGRTEVSAKKAVPAGFGRRTALRGNLDRFLEATTPSVPALYISKTMRDWRTCDKECGAYFKLEDLWDSFKEWSAYGAGVPIMINGRDSVVQYYVPYLSGIQLYADSSVQSLAASDGEDTSSDSEMESGGRCKNCVGNNGALFREVGLADELYSDDSDGGDSQGSLIFEYLEYDRPYCREPLADKIVDLAKQFPVLKTIKSCDLLPSSWFSVAWYPIYRIPTGPTLRDLDACFLTFHFLSTPMKASACCHPISLGRDGIPKISLPVFGLASYKFRSFVWSSNGGGGGGEGKLANTLLQAADKWLRLLNANLPDYRFFASQQHPLRR